MLKLSNLTKPHEPGHHYSEEKKFEIVTFYLATGNMHLVAQASGIPYRTLCYWKTQPWFKEYVFEIGTAKRAQTNTKLAKLVDKSLDIIEDRLEKGDVVLNNKTGKMARRPAALRDVAKVADSLMAKQLMLEKVKLDESALQKQDTMQDTLKMLAEEFAKFNGTKPKNKDVIDVEFKENTDALHAQRSEDGEECSGLQTGEREVQLSPGGSEEAGREEFSTSPIDEGRLSPEGGW